MSISMHDRDLFQRKVAAGFNFVPVSQQWPADLDTPVSTWLKVGEGNGHGVLLESVEGGERVGRWSVVASNPLWILESRGETSLRRWRDGREEHLSGNPFTLIRSCLAPYRTAAVPGLPALGQLFGIWGYELIRWIEPTVPVHRTAPDAPPDGLWMLVDSLLVFDQVRRLITAVAYADLSNGQNPEQAHDAALQRLEALRLSMLQPLRGEPLVWSDAEQHEPATRSNRSQADFEAAVRQARDHIAAGDVFQLVLSQRLETEVEATPFEIYRSLRLVNPSPYMAFFDLGGWHLIGSSPEVMVKAEVSEDGRRMASLRPIAGTRRRGHDPAADRARAEELLADPKERAEHVMLVDLGRNDLGRVCRPGTVAVTELMVIERYSHVMHIVSELVGELQRDCDVLDLLMASFPAGTVSGAPKIRAMQLIHACEPDARGPYSGVYGAVDLQGALNTAITIRTLIAQPAGNGRWHLSVQSGAGVVADSQPTLEYEETLNKARGMLRALGSLAVESG